VTGSIIGTASFATTASFVQNAVSASFATTSTSASFASTASFAASGFTVGISQIQTATVASSIVGANNLFTTSTGSFAGAKYLYTATSGSNARIGEIFAVWNRGSVQFTDISTLDIGSTTVVTASVTIVTAQAQLNFQTNTSGWNIKSQATFI
jgi:acetyltransferase-like isoleucine patch superfamily enzyme